MKDGKASLIVLISGSGSNLQAIIDAIKNNALDAEIKAVIGNQENAIGLQRAEKANISTYLVKHQNFSSRELFDQAMIDIIEPLQADLVVLAGFMRILSNNFIEQYQGRLVNIHPSLLPKYKGLNTHQLAIDNHDTEHGASVHYVNHELDSGPVVLQAVISISDSDSAETLAARVLEQEHKIFPMALQMICNGRLMFTNKQLRLDNKLLKKPLLWKDSKLIS